MKPQIGCCLFCVFSILLSFGCSRSGSIGGAPPEAKVAKANQAESKPTSQVAEKFDPFAGPKPLAILTQSDPWLMVVGSDTPRTAIYEDGTVIFVRRDKERLSYFVKHLSPRELEDVKSKILSFGDVSKIKRHYDLAPNVTDMPVTTMYLDIRGQKAATSVYGLMVSDTDLPAYTVGPQKTEPDKIPESLKKVHRYLTALDFADAKKWQPNYVEVMLWGYEYAPDESIHWPSDWPGLNSPRTWRRGNMYSIFLPGNQLERLRKFLSTQKEKGAVEVDGKKWAASYRYSFPCEPIWVQTLRSE